jgi:aryl-alcohol dehydrogenase-like predicted oxidoreductase
MAVSIPKRHLGKDGPLVPALGFGLMGISLAYGPTPSDEERLALLDRAYELGERFWDTAASYGDSEVLIGKWLKQSGKREDIFLATKFAFEGSWTNPVDSSPEAVRKEIASSLERLGVEYVDLYYCKTLALRYLIAVCSVNNN